MFDKLSDNFLFIFLNLVIIVLLDSLKYFVDFYVPNNWIIFLSVIVFTFFILKKKILILTI